MANVKTATRPQTASQKAPTKGKTALANGAGSNGLTVHSRKALSDTARKNVAAAKVAKGKAPAQKAPAPKAKAPALKRVAPPARTSKFEGKTIATTLKANPRREGTFGHTSFQIVLRAKGGRISYADYKARGGRNNDLQWDIDHGYVTVK